MHINRERLHGTRTPPPFVRTCRQDPISHATAADITHGLRKRKQLEDTRSQAVAKTAVLGQ